MTDHHGQSPTPLGAAIDRLAAKDPDAPALHFEGAVVTRRQLADASTRLAHEMAALGVEHGQMVTIGLPNGIRFYEAVIATWKLGAIPQPISYRLPPPELRKIVDVADPALVVGLDPAAIGEDRPWLPADHVVSDDVSVEPLPAATSPSWKAPTSGGSTGRPKLIVSTTPAHLESITAIAPALRMREGERFLCTGPLYHNAPFQFSLLALLLGGEVIVMPRFDAAAALELAERYRVTYVSLVPTMMSRILRVPDDERQRRDLSAVRVALHTAAPCPPVVKREWIAWLGPDRILELYSATEAQAATLIDGAEWLAHPGSVGRVVVGEIEIRDDDGAPVAPGAIGELWVRSSEDSGPSYRYLGASATASDGWETLGDMGWFDDDGYLHLADRRGDMILVGGANVYPAEVEAALEEHGDVVAACVIGLPDDDYGNCVHAIVESREQLEATELLDHLAARLAPYKLPRTFELVREPLRDDAGKLRRGALRDARVSARGEAGEPAARQ